MNNTEQKRIAKLEYLREYRKKNKDRIAAYDKNRRDYNPVYQDQQRKSRAKFHSDPQRHSRYIEQIKTHVHHRRSRDGSFNLSQWNIIKQACASVCLQCGSSNDIELDHIIPLKRGGTNWITNIQPLCRACNRSKYIKADDYRPEWVKLLAWFLAFGLVDPQERE
jgi:5-methylcytosine-specific restriction endonuclease McrA